MATELQIAANRRNAQLSTGPKTPEGKAISSQNALKTGIDAKTLIVKYENPETFEDLTARYYDHFAPAGEDERALVDVLISSEWMRLRYLRVETSIWDSGLDDSKTLVGKAFGWSSEALLRVDRRLNSALRSYTHALKQLQTIQSKRPAAPEPPPSRPAAQNDSPPVAAEPLTPESGPFLISNNSAPAPDPLPAAAQPRAVTITPAQPAPPDRLHCQIESEP